MIIIAANLPNGCFLVCIFSFKALQQACDSRRLCRICLTAACDLVILLIINSRVCFSDYCKQSGKPFLSIADKRARCLILFQIVGYAVSVRIQFIIHTFAEAGTINFAGCDTFAVAFRLDDFAQELSNLLGALDILKLR